MKKKKKTNSWWDHYQQRLEARQEQLHQSRLELDENQRKRSDNRARKNRSSVLYGKPSASGGGGGGKVVMRVGGTGPRGTRFPKVIHAKPPRSVIIKSKYIPNGKFAKRRLGIWLNYCVKDKEYEKEMGAEKLSAELLREKEFFSKNSEGISKEEAQKLIEENTGKRVAYHQMILSSGEREVDPQNYARHQMEALERRLGHKLTWVANVHRDTGPDKMHINVTIAGSIPDFQKRDSTLPYKGEEIDIEKVAEQDKFQSTDGTWYSKFHSKSELKNHSKWLRKESDRLLDEDTFKNKLWRWIGTKDRYGEDCYGMPPLKDKEKERELAEYMQHAGSRHEEGKKRRGIDLENIPESEKVHVFGWTYTKFDSQHSLKMLAAQANRDPEVRLPKDEYRKIQSWINAKETGGNDAFGEPPMKNLTGKERNELDKRELEFQFELSRIQDVTDRMAHELTRGKEISPQAVRYNKSFERAARLIEGQGEQQRLKTSWNNRGDVYIDRESLEGMRTHGNYYVYMQRNFDRELELAIERELGERDREREREPSVDAKHSLARRLNDDTGREEFKQNMPGITPDSVVGDQDRGHHKREEEKERDDDDDGFSRR
ncbi:MAG TPA: hypothetical protein V6D22_10710 [Candidatus Obscuribacterales bacterium]